MLRSVQLTSDQDVGVVFYMTDDLLIQILSDYISVALARSAKATELLSPKRLDFLFKHRVALDPPIEV